MILQAVDQRCDQMESRLNVIVEPGLVCGYVFHAIVPLPYPQSIPDTASHHLCLSSRTADPHIHRGVGYSAPDICDIHNSVSLPCLSPLYQFPYYLTSPALRRLDPTRINVQEFATALIAD